MRRILSLALALIFVFSISAMAAEVEIKDAGKDIITLKGSTGASGKVSVMILNPGYSASDVLSQSRYAVQFYGTANEGDDGFSIDVRMTDPHEYKGGEYTAVYSNGATTKTETFVFYFRGKKIEMIQALNEDGAQGLSKEIYKVYSLDGDKLYGEVSTASIERVLSSKIAIPEDVDVMYEELLDTIHIAAYSDGVDLLVRDGELAYVDVVGIDEEETYEDYLSKISDDGMKKVHTSIMGKEYEKGEEIAEAFSEAVVLNYITNPKSLGFGHISDVFEKYDEFLAEKGIDSELLDDVENKNYVYKKLATSTDSTFEELATTYKKALKAADNKSQSSGGGGGGGGGGGSSSSTITIPSDGPSLPQISGQENGSGYLENPVTPFEDMKDVQWASEAVGALYNRNIISGKSSKVFDPSGLVTREEFAKMAVLAFVGKPDGSQCAFTDVTGWSLPYVATAFSNGIIQGISQTSFVPTGNITREQAATIILRSMEKAGYVFENEPMEFDDEEDISDWAKESVGLLAGEEVILGREDGVFYPGENMTRAEAAKLIYTAMVMTGGIN